MTTAEKITFGIALLGALGVGALLKAGFDHFLSRKEKRVDLAEKSIKLADAMISTMEAQMTRLGVALESAQREAEELRSELARRPEGPENDKLRQTSTRLNQALMTIDSLQEEVSKLRHPSRGFPGLGRGLGALIPSGAPPDERSEDQRYLAEGESRATVAQYLYDDARRSYEKALMEYGYRAASAEDERQS